MKKFISTIAFVIGFVAITMAQDATNTAASLGAEELAKSKEAGTYVYTMPEGLTNERVEKASSYYLANFNVEFEASSKEATIKMVSEEAQNRAVMLRFLSACGVHYVLVDGDTLNLSDFMEKHLQ